MVRKVFKVGDCPFKSGVPVGSVSCRNCKDYKGEPAYCTFVICSNEGEIEQKAAKIAREAPEIEQPKRKRGRPPGKAKKKPVNSKTKKK